MRIWWQKILAFCCKIFVLRYSCKCGHKAHLKTAISINGEPGVYSLGKDRLYCPQCWLKAVIKCAWCNSPILPGDPITLYTPTKEFKIPEHAVIFKETPTVQLVGCLGWDCACTGMDRAGFWVMPGKVEQVVTPLQMLMSSNDSMVIINDLSNQQEAIPIPEKQN